jgi:hypothetical protein
MRRPGGTFGIPAALALASGTALIAGLLGDGVNDVVAWVGLAAPLVVTSAFVICAARQHR